MAFRAIDSGEIPIPPLPAEPLTGVGPTGPQGSPGIPGPIGSHFVQTQLVWAVDPVNGNDSAPGVPGSPLKTIARWCQLNRGAIYTQPATVTIMGALPNSDVFDWQDFIFSGNGSIVFQGTPTVVRSGVFTGGVVQENDAANQPQVFEDTGVASWVGDVGRLVQITSGPRAGASAWVSKDLGSSQARGSSPRLTFHFQDPVLNMLAGDPYTVYTQPQFNFGRAAGNSYGEPHQIVFQDLAIYGSIGTAGIGDAVISTGQSELLFHRCTTQNITFWQNDQSIQFANLINSYANGFITGGTPNGVQCFAGIVHATVAVGTRGIFYLDGNVYLQGSQLLIDRDGLAVVGKAAIFDVAGDAVLIKGFGRVHNRNIQLAAHRLWGSGSTGAGVHARARGQFMFDTTIPIVTGANDFMVSGRTTARAWNETAGAPTGPIATTWNNLALAIASGGLGNAAQDMTTGSFVGQNL